VARGTQGLPRECSQDCRGRESGGRKSVGGVGAHGAWER
jgi:hypothetical protein